jgi:2-dehydropantoate 2-reductase
MKIAVFGTGGVGGYFGGLLANAGRNIAFVARGEHLIAMRERGLRVKSPHGDFRLEEVMATDNPGEIGPVDYLIVAVKHYQLEEAIAHMGPLIEAQTVIVPLLNGVDAHEILLASLGSGVVVGGLCSVSSLLEAPGVIRQESQLRRIVVGELDRRPGPRLQRLVDTWRECGVEVVHSSDIFKDIWTKFLFIASFGGVSSLARANSGEILRVPQTRALLLEAMREIEALAHARGILLAHDVVDQAMRLLENFEPTTTSSMQRDVAGGGQFELEAFSGAVVRLAEEHGRKVPVHRAIYALLRPALDRAAGG